MSRALLIDIEQLARDIAALKVEAPDKPRSAAGEPWHVGFNDAIDEVLQLLGPARQQAQRLTGEAREAHDRSILNTALLVASRAPRRRGPRR